MGNQSSVGPIIERVSADAIFVLEPRQFEATVYRFDERIAMMSLLGNDLVLPSEPERLATGRHQDSPQAAPE